MHHSVQVYSATNVELVTRTRTEHLSDQDKSRSKGKHTQHSLCTVVSKVVWTFRTLDFIVKNIKFSLSGIDHHVFLCSSESKLSFHLYVSSSSEKLE